MSDGLLVRLTALRRTVRVRLVAYGLCVVAAGGVASFLTIVTVDWLLSLPAALRIAVAGLFTTGFAVAALHWIVRPLQAALTLGELAAHLEARWATLDDRLVSAVNFMEHGGTGSPRMMERVVGSAEKILDNVSMSSVLTSKPLLVRAAIMIASFAVLATLSSQSPDWVRTGAYRYIYPWGHIEWPHTVSIRPLTRDQVVAIGSSVTVRMKVDRGLDPTLRGILRFRDSGGSNGAITMQRDAHDTFHATIDAVTTDLTYWFEAGDDSTSQQPGLIQAVRRPEIVEAFLTIEPPAYASGRPSRVQELLPGPVNVPQGGRVHVALRTSKPIRTGRGAGGAALRLSNGAKQNPLVNMIPLRGDAENPILLTASFDVDEDVTFSIELRDEHGIENHRGDDYTLITVPDRPPSVTVQRPGAITEVTPRALLTIQISAEDDFGLVALEWKIDRIQGDATETIDLTDKMARESRIGNVYAAARDTWDLTSLSLTGGDVLVCTATAYDNRPEAAGGSQFASAVPIRVKIISEAELEVRLKSETATLETRIRRLALDQAELLDDTREQRRRADSWERTDDEPSSHRQTLTDWQSRLAGLAVKQVRLARRARDVADRFGSLRQRIERNRINDREAGERFLQLANSLKQVASGPMASASRSLTEVRHHREPEPFRRSLQDAEVSEQSALDRLRFALAALSQWGGFHELLTQTRDLAGRQEEIRTRTASIGKSLIGQPVESLNKGEADRLQRLAREQDQLANDVQQLMTRMAQIAATPTEQDSSQQQSVGAALRVGRAREVSKQSRSAAASVKNNRTAAAAMAQKSTTDALRKMATALQKHDGRQLDELRKKLERAQDQIAWLIAEQEGIRAATDEASRMADTDILAAGLATKQRSLKRNTRFLGNDLAEIPTGVAVADIVRRASTPMGDAESFLRRSKGQPAVDAQNEALVLLHQAVERLNAAAQNSAQEALRRSLDQIREDLEQIAMQQEDVNSGIVGLIETITKHGRLGRREARRASKLARQQRDVQRLLAEQAPDFDAVVVYQWALERIAGWMDESRARLSGRTIDDRLVRRTVRIVAELRKLIQAIVDTQALPTDTQFVESSEGSGGANGSHAQRKPVPSVAELLVLKAMQSDVNLRTVALYDAMDPDEASESQLQDLQALGEDQTEISRLTLRLTETARRP